MAANVYSSSCWNSACSYRGWNAANALLKVFDVLDHLTGPVSPSLGPASGGTPLMVPGYGFDVNASYFCAFENDLEGIITTATVSLPPNMISCTTPLGSSAWGSNFAANDMGRNTLPQKFRVYKSLGLKTSVDSISAQSGTVNISGTAPVRPIKYVKIENEFVGVGNIATVGAVVLMSFGQRGAFASQISAHPAGASVECLSEILNTDPQSDASSFSHVTEWDLGSTSALLSKDYFNITFEGFGFDPQRNYSFVIRSSTVSMTSQLGYPLSSSKLLLSKLRQ